MYVSTQTCIIIWNIIPFSMQTTAILTTIIVLYIGQDTVCIANCYIRICTYIECYSQYCTILYQNCRHISLSFSYTLPQLTPRTPQSPAVHTTTISSGVSNMSRRLLTGLSVLPPSWAFRASTSCCHFCCSSQGMIYTRIRERKCTGCIHQSKVSLCSLSASCKCSLVKRNAREIYVARVTLTSTRSPITHIWGEIGLIPCHTSIGTSYRQL